MGKIVEYRCPSCQEVWQIRTGHGISHATLQYVLHAFPDELQKEIINNTDGEHIPGFTFNYRAAICQQCKKIVAVPELILLKKKQTYVVGCPDCGRQAEILSESFMPFCPCCGLHRLETRNSGHWD